MSFIVKLKDKSNNIHYMNINSRILLTVLFSHNLYTKTTKILLKILTYKRIQLNDKDSFLPMVKFIYFHRRRKVSLFK